MCSFLIFKDIKILLKYIIINILSNSPKTLLINLENNTNILVSLNNIIIYYKYLYFVLETIFHLSSFIIYNLLYILIILNLINYFISLILS